jgi:hypothetical protein
MGVDWLCIRKPWRRTFEGWNLMADCGSKRDAEGDDGGQGRGTENTTKETDSGLWVLGMGHGAGRGLLRRLGRCGRVLRAAEKRLTKLWSSPSFFYLGS